MKTLLEELIKKLKEREAFLENTDCICASLEVQYIINLCENLKRKKS